MASIHYRIAVGPQAGRKALTLYSLPPEQEEKEMPLLARLAGFTLHAELRVPQAHCASASQG